MIVKPVLIDTAIFCIGKQHYRIQDGDCKRVDLLAEYYDAVGCVGAADEPDYDWAAVRAAVVANGGMANKSITVVLPQRAPIRVMSETTAGVYPTPRGTTDLQAALIAATNHPDITERLSVDGALIFTSIWGGLWYLEAGQEPIRLKDNIKVSWAVSLTAHRP